MIRPGAASAPPGAELLTYPTTCPPVPPQGSPLWLSAPASARCRAQEHAAALLPAESGPTPAAARTLLIPEIEYEEQSL